MFLGGHQCAYLQRRYRHPEEKIRGRPESPVTSDCQTFLRASYLRHLLKRLTRLVLQKNQGPLALVGPHFQCFGRRGVRSTASHPDSTQPTGLVQIWRVVRSSLMCEAKPVMVEAGFFVSGRLSAPDGPVYY